MTKLHLISDELELPQLMDNAARYLNEQDPLLFIADGVNGLLVKTNLQYLSSLQNTIFALAADCNCRGITHLLPASISQISDHKMVELSVDSSQIISW